MGRHSARWRLEEQLDASGLDALVAEVGCPIQGLGLENAEFKRSRSKLGVGRHGGLIDVSDPCGLSGYHQIRLLDSGITDMRYVGLWTTMLLQVTPRDSIWRATDVTPANVHDDWIDTSKS